MSVHGNSSSRSEGELSAATEPDTDAAEAAGFGGIAWADEVAEEPADQGEQEERAEQDDAVDGSGPLEEAEAEAEPETEISVEDLVQDLERVTVERDQYLDTSRRLQAELENYRKAVAKRETEARERANESLVTELLPVLDACDGAMASGAEDVEPVRTALVDALVKQGLERIDDQDAPFDPSRHDAVAHEPAPDGEDGQGQVVAEVMRAGYSWKGRVVRPAMVRVRG